MRKEDYNSFKEYSERSIPKGGAIFEYLNLRPDEDNPGRVALGMTFIPPTDVILVNGQEKAIACIASSTIDGTVYFDNTIYFSGENKGRIILRAGSVEDERRFKYLLHHNWCADSPFRDTSIDPKYRLINLEVEAEKSLADEDEIFEAQTKVRSLNDSQYTLIGSELGVEGGAKAVKAYLLSIAKTDPSRITTILDSMAVAEKKSVKFTVDADKKKLVKDALKAKLLQDNPLDKTVSYKGTIVYNYNNTIDQVELYNSLEPSMITELQNEF